MPNTNNYNDALQSELARRQAQRRGAIGMRTPSLMPQQAAVPASPQSAQAAQPATVVPQPLTVAAAQQPQQPQQSAPQVQQSAQQVQQSAQQVQQPVQPTAGPMQASAPPTDAGEMSIRQRYEARKKASGETLDALEKQAQATYDGAMKPYETLDYSSWLQRMGEPSVEEQKRRQKRARSSAIIAGVGDVLASLANVWATTKGAKSTYKAGTLSAAAQARAEKIADEGAKLRVAYRKYRYANDEAERKAAATTMRARMEAIMKITGMRLKEGNDLERALNSEIDSYRRGKVQASQVARNEAGTKQSEAATRLTEARTKTENELRGVKRAKEAAQAASARAMAEKRAAGTEGKGDGTGNYEFLGQRYKTKANYDQAVMSAAKEAGIQVQNELFRNRPISEIAAEVTRKHTGATGEGPKRIDAQPALATPTPGKPQSQNKPKRDSVNSGNSAASQGKKNTNKGKKRNANEGKNNNSNKVDKYKNTRNLGL